MAFQRLLAFFCFVLFLINVSVEPHSTTFKTTAEEGIVLLAPWYFPVDRGEKAWEKGHDILETDFFFF